MKPDVEAVTELIREAAATLILPRFRRLRPEDIEDKSTSPDRQDLVTAVDRDVESWLTQAFRALEPGAAVVGEESVHADPALLTRLGGDAPVWVIDPIDGTKNFARGDDGFGVMVARVERGHATAGWIMLPARDEVFVAEAGSGAGLNGARIHVPSTGEPGALRGSLFTRYMPAEVRARVTASARDGLELFPDSACAAVEYTDTLRGAKDFLVYYRLLPWDHAAPALILTEAGGTVEHLDGRLYSVRSDNQVTIVARSREVAGEIRERLWIKSEV